MRKIDDIRLLQLSIGGFAAVAVSFMLMPLTLIVTIAGLLFWLGLALGIGAQAVLMIRAKKAGWKTGPKRWGLVTFFANKWAKIADLAMVAGALLTAYALYATGGYGYVCYVLLSATVFAFCMHCILNGKTLLFATRRTAPSGKNQKNEKVNE